MRFSLLILAAITVSIAACNDGSGDNTKAPVPNLSQIIAQSPNFSTLNAALIKTNLSSALSSGTLTVFAPDNGAFINSGITNINSIPTSTLDSILKYHVLNQIVGSSAIPVSDTLKTLLGQNIYASRNANGITNTNPNGIFANGKAISQSDIKGSNGVIHVLTGVLIPPTQTIAQLAASDTSFSFLVAALAKVGLSTAVAGPGKYTVYAPTNAAFRAAGITDINAVPLATLTAVLKYHVISTNVFVSDFVNNGTITTLQGGTITTSRPDTWRVKITGSAQPASVISKPNIVATNGVIHVIDLVMLP